MIIYLIGSLQNERIPRIAKWLRHEGHQVYDEWIAHGPDVDEFWRDYSEERGHSYIEALRGEAARAPFEQDRMWLDICDLGLMVCPAGRSAHLELGYIIGQGKPAHVLLEGEPERWDLMLRFATGVHLTLESFLRNVEATSA